MKVLVYIPCHTDFALALNQAKVVREEIRIIKNRTIQDNFSIEIIISVNSYLPSDSEKEMAAQIADRIIYNGISYMFSMNIANSFTIALDKKPDFLWIVSANDPILTGALEKILTEFMQEPSIDLLVATSNSNKTFIEKQIIDPLQPVGGLYYALITGVFYRLERLFPFLHVGSYMAWTGWPHLAVMQSAMDGLGGLKIKTISVSSVFKEGERDLDTISQYGFSIYGMLILGSVFKNSDIACRKFIRKFTYRNYFRWSMYSRKWKYSNNLISKENYLGWNQKIAETLIWKNSLFAYIFYIIFKNTPMRKISQIKRNIRRELKLKS